MHYPHPPRTAALTALFRTRRATRRRLAAAAAALCALATLLAVSGLRGHAASPAPSDRVTISVVGTSDLHGSVFDRNGRGGLAIFAGYVRNLRAARAADNGAVLVLDAGDTFQGTVESNLTEGGLVVDAYNALGLTAEAIGNHDFDFGAVDSAPPLPTPAADQRGALKAAAARARYPFLAANLLDAATGRPVDWPNVRPSVLVEAAGVKIGLIGVMTIDALRSTLAANVHGLTLAPLGPTIAAEATALRARGATVVVVTAHAGGRCARFEDPADVSTCDVESEIFQVARGLRTGLVDVIVAGHTHQALAQAVNGIAITQSYFAGRAFGRVDVTVDRGARQVAGTRVFPPREVCAEIDPGTETCDPAQASTAPREPARYEDRPVLADPAIADAMAPALARVRAMQAVPLGPTLDTPFPRAGDLESPLGNLFADAFRDAWPGTDVSVSNNNTIGGLRADLPPGLVTFGGLYSVFPFDNRLVRLTLRAGALADVFSEELDRGRRGTLGVSGVRVVVGCAGSGLRVALHRSSGAPIDPTERLSIVTTDFLAAGMVFQDVAPAEAYSPPASAPLAREVVANWLRQRHGRLVRDQFVDPARPRWDVAGAPASGCRAM